jgi:hypothetical protein
MLHFKKAHRMFSPKRIWCFFFIAMLFFTCFDSAHAHINFSKIYSFQEARGLLDTLPQDALVIFDLDETLFIDRVESLPTVLTEPGIDVLIHQLQKRGIKVIGLTNSISTLNFESAVQEEWRHRTLVKLGVDFSKSFQDCYVFKELPIYEGGHPVFSRGVLYTNRIPKGDVLGAFLDRIKDSFDPSVVVFFDDLPDNLESVSKELSLRGKPKKMFLYYRIIALINKGFNDMQIIKLILKNTPRKKTNEDLMGGPRK